MMATAQTRINPIASSDADKQGIKDAYDDIAIAYNEWANGLDQDFRLEFLDKYLTQVPTLKSQPGTILELGCGAGKPVLHKMLTINPQIKAIGLDFSDSQLDLARQNLGSFGDRVQLRQGDMSKLDLEQGSVSAIIAMYSMIHLPTREQLELFAKFSRWLKPGGTFLCNFEQAPLERDIWGSWLDGKGRLFQHGAGEEETMRVIRANGFEIMFESLAGGIEAGDRPYVWVIGRKRA